MGFRYGSVCSGIEAATEGWHHLGWEPAWFSEIEEFPRQYLTHHYPKVPLYGDFTQLRDILPADQRKIDLLVGGTPCQDFSVAGLRKGLDGDRGNLSLEFMRLADALRPQWVLWENVPGVLSQSGGRAFGSILGALAELGYGCAYRVLDAKNHGVPQRRRRVFLVGYLGDWRRAAAVLFDTQSMRRDPPKSKAAEQEVAGTLGGGSGSRGWAPDTDRMTFVPEVARSLLATSGRGFDGHDRETIIAKREPLATNAEGSLGFTLTCSNLAKTVGNQTPLIVEDAPQEGVAATLRAVRNHHDNLVYAPEIAGTLLSGGNETGGHRPPGSSVDGTDHLIVECVTGEQTHALTSEGADASEDGTGRGTPIVPVMSVAENQRAEVVLSEQTQALSVGGGKPGQGYPAILFNHQSGGSSMQLSPQTEVANTLVANQTQAALVENYRVRRLTPRECERLQAFPDDRTLIPIGMTGGKNPKVKMSSDSVRYRALGNSMAVVVMRWLGNRIDFVHHLERP